MAHTNTNLTDQELTLNRPLLKQHWDVELSTRTHLGKRWEKVNGVLVGQWVVADKH
ncbi:MAG: hypothetical protein AAGG02_04890 [Cyanobacteria bacterium P01_H01_bin.15]